MYIVHTSVLNSDDFQSLLKRKVPRIEKQGMLKCRIYGNSYSVHSQVVYSFIETNGQHRNWINKISSFFSQFSFVSRFKNYCKKGHSNSLTAFKIFIISIYFNFQSIKKYGIIGIRSLIETRKTEPYFSLRYINQKQPLVCSVSLQYLDIDTSFFVGGVLAKTNKYIWAVIGTTNTTFCKIKFQYKKIRLFSKVSFLF